MLLPNKDYIVQGHRYNIYEELGCTTTFVNRYPSYLIMVMWPLVLGAVSLLYCRMYHSQAARHEFYDSWILQHSSYSPS